VADTLTTTFEDLEREILDAVHRTTSPLDAYRVEFRTGEDHDGESAHFIDIWYRHSAIPVKGGQLIEEGFAIRDLLHARRDHRFPYVRRHFDAAQTFGAAA
jgi:hypothetical protein